MIYSCYNRRNRKPLEFAECDKAGIIKMVLAKLEEDKRMSVAQPQREGISAIRLDEDNWTPHTSQIGSPPSGNPLADNNNPGQFTGGTQPQAVGEPTANYAPGQPTSPTKAAWRTVTGANIQP